MAESSLETYIGNLENALKSANARETCFPMDRALRRERVLWLARQVGYGLRDYPIAEVRRALGGTYSRLVVRHCFDSIGPAVDAKEWIGALENGAGHAF
jgi:hypothetical protein